MENTMEMSDKMNEFLDKVDALCFEYGYVKLYLLMVMVGVNNFF
jgi:hypothetical protein